MGVRLQVMTSEGELRRAYDVLKELRTELAWADFVAVRAAAQQADGYTLVAAIDGEQVVAVMGYRILSDFVHGRHLYIDDLVTAANRRSKGVGAQLLRHAEAEARRLGCQGLRLCTGIGNDAGKRFYEREGWSLKAVAYKKRLDI